MEEIQKAAAGLLGILRSPHMRSAVEAFDEFTALSLSRKHLLGYKGKLECDVFLGFYADPNPHRAPAKKLMDMASRLARIREYSVLETE